MKDRPEKFAIVAACRMLVQPIASLLLKCGMTWREFSLLSKSVFVDVASREYGINGRPTNISRVSLLTGIARKEVKRLRDMPGDPDTAPADKSTGATRLLSGWHQDPDFLGEDGQPAALDASRFAALCERYAGDIPPSAMRKELIRVGAVRESGQRLVAASRYYMPVRSDPQWILSAGSVYQDLGNNLSFNLEAAGGEDTRFLGRATNTRLPRQELPHFRRFLEQRGQEFLETVDDWMTRHAAQSADGADQVRVGIGLFAIEGGSDTQQDAEQVNQHEQ